MGISKIDGSLSREGIEECLQVKGIKIAPENIDTTFVKYVYETSQFSVLETNDIINETKPLDGLDTEEIPLIGPEGYGANNITNQQNAKFLCFLISLVYDAAGLAADIAASVSVRWVLQYYVNGTYRNAIGNIVPINNLDVQQYIAGSHNIHIPIIVPFNMGLQLKVWRNSGAGNWPANTDLYFRGLINLRKRGLYI